MSIKFYSKTEQGWTIPALFDVMTFPGGEPHIKDRNATDGYLAKYPYQIADLRGADSHDLMTLAMWADLMRSRSEKMVLILPYLPGARADRGAPLGTWVYAEFIESMVDPRQIITLDPHSPVSVETLTSGFYQSVTVYPFERIIKRELGDRGDWRTHPYAGVIAPDKGAVKRAQAAAAVLGVPVFKAEKVRDFDSGELSGFTCEELPKSGKLLLVDDICDGGGTFIGLSQTLWDTQQIERDRLDLWVTHGIFSKGIAELTYYFDHIYTTDSWGTTEQDENLTVIPVLPYLMGEINV